ncbi:tyrosine--tRNA ligase [Nanchangia anserum]|uniref:Tyrosine--tRNA ligase n=1 Tax=Nanchangia anserum TaxID=2692125 RepID=A0A8I0G6Y2_9ACTO|nr:tyrosine--tRNA ligase [Nanchangia anserum]MBD3688950.1 tyrosine--tRNA ligase [Nanchangia anserum]QOX81210.1 tyrosine--tRNA ligase [Nanchangia anserum]
MSDIIEELRWRGLIEQSSDLDAIRAQLAQGPVTFYCGFDPTAPSLHHGHLVQLLLMRHLQRAGHRPIALVGGATGLIGDPRMSGERQLHSKDVVAQWVTKLRDQIGQLLDFNGDNAAIMVNNLDWTSQLSAIDFLRDLGKHFRMGTMLGKEAVARRLSSSEGISYTEFSYQVLQANDFLELYRRYGCLLETGGNDQWGNLVGGMELIHKTEGAQAHCMTTPIITKSDGTKFGKSEGGAIWLNPEMMSPYAFYQFWLGTEDADVIRLLKIFTFRDRDEIARLEQAVAERPFAREAQKVLAADVTEMVHGQSALENVLAATEALWGRGELSTLDAETLGAAVADLPAPAEPVELGETTIVDVLVASGLVKSRREARQTVNSGGAYLNNVKVDDEARVITSDDLLAGGWVLFRRGKRNLGVARAEG